MGQGMTINYIKQFRDEETGELTNEQNADSEIRCMNNQIQMLRAALEAEMQTVADLRELLDAVRKIAYDINEQLLRGRS